MMFFGLVFISKVRLAGQLSTDVHASVAGSSNGRPADSVSASDR
jgi:hypothetical protein